MFDYHMTDGMPAYMLKLNNKLSRADPFVSFVLLDVRDHCFPCDNFQGLKFKNFNFAF